MKILHTIYFILIAFFSFSQQSKIDSLLLLLKNDEPDTIKLQHLNILAWEIYSKNPDSAFILNKEALQLAEVIISQNNTTWNNTSIMQATQIEICESYYQIAVFHYYNGNYSVSLQFYKKALDVLEKMKGNFEIRKAAILQSSGLIYFEQGDYSSALNYFYQSLKTFEAFGNKDGVSAIHVNIGNVFATQKDYHKALDYYYKALKTFEELGIKKGIAIILGNIGGIYSEQKDYTEALVYYSKALKLNEELVNKHEIANNLGNIGVIYYYNKNNNKALEYYFKALKINEEFGYKSGITNVLGNIGELYISEKKYSEAKTYLSKALSIANEIGSLEDKRAVNENLSELYSKTGNYQKSLEYYKEATIAKDSLFNAEKIKEITRNEMNYEFEKKVAIDKVNQKIKNLKMDIITGISVFLLLLVLAFLWFAFKTLRVDTKQTFEIIFKFLYSLVSRPNIHK